MLPNRQTELVQSKRKNKQQQKRLVLMAVAEYIKMNPAIRSWN